MHSRKTLIRLIVTGTLLITGTAIHSQAVTTTPNSADAIRPTVVAASIAPNTRTFAVDDTCDQRLAKALASLDEADGQIKKRDDQIAEFKVEISKQDVRYIEILGMLKEYATLDSKGKKAWWKRAGKVLLDKIDKLTDPKVITAILEIVVLTKAIKQ